MPNQKGSLKLFRLAGIQVYLHWSWFLIAIYEVQWSAGRYHSVVWGVAEYLGLFVIVTMHEFGHALACRQVGGKSDTIVLWPLGGVAYVQPPPRAGATLWSIAAGPLVNVALIPVLFGLHVVSIGAGRPASTDLVGLLGSISQINFLLLAFNILPIYPLDGGQILRSLLWFPFGRARSLMIATTLGFVGIVGFVALALWLRSTWLVIMAVFLLLNCWAGLQSARALARIGSAPRRLEFACPGCKSAPPAGPWWKCGGCQQEFDTFATQATCPHCRTQFPATQCFECGETYALPQWTAGVPMVVPAASIHP